VERAQRILRDPTGSTDALRKEARHLVDSAVHPDTGQIVPLPFRMCAHVPMNTMILVGMLSSTGVWSTVLWQVWGGTVWAWVRGGTRRSLR
jgi:hypothetical protein